MVSATSKYERKQIPLPTSNRVYKFAPLLRFFIISEILDTLNSSTYRRMARWMNNRTPEESDRCIGKFH